MIRGGWLVALVILIAGVGAAPAPATRPTTIPSIVRQPQYPLKDRRTLFSDEEIARARKNVAKYESAKAVADSWIRIADEWVKWDDAELAGLIPSASVPRDWGVSASSRCPECGKTIGDPNNKPGWIVDPKKPFKVTCPLCDSVFPSNDFETYYRSGYKTKIGWDTKYVDDGWGWTDPKTGEKQWWVAFANHWIVHGRLMHVVPALGRAYLLTGDERYAHKALVLLHRYAEVYPEMDYESQSRYGTMISALGGRYPGKIAYNTWETDLVTGLAEAYDACWEAIDGDAALQRTTGKTGKEIRAFIEANLLEDAIDAYFDGKILGNFGMHQSTLAHLAIVRQHGEQEKWFDLLMNQSSRNYQHLGLRFALYNVVFRDGVPFETSSHYNSIWVRKISEYARLLEEAGRKPFEIPRLRRLYDAVLAQIVTRAHNPSVGDGGSVWGGIFAQDPATFQTAYRQYDDPRYLRFLTAMYGMPKEGGFTTFESLLHPPIDVPATMPTTHPALPPRLLDGYGMAILNNPQDTVGAALYYGMISSHGHFDRLHFELFANGHPMMPDLGYPDAMNDFVPGIYTWSKNTIAHNTVTVDASRQPENVPGTVELFADGEFARVTDVSAAETYPQCYQYRRAMIMVDCGDERSYFVDVFTVSGGRQHDYSLHGPPGAFETSGGQWSEPLPGTLAGEEVEVGQIYDDSKLGAEGYKGGYSNYRGSGFQHFYNVRRHKAGETVAQWSHEKEPAAKLRIRVLPQPQQELIVANARVSQVKNPQELTYLIARRTSTGSVEPGGQKLASRFVSVIEPYEKEPLIRSIRSIELTDGEGVAVEVIRSDGGKDLVVYDPTGTKKRLQDGTVETDARAAVIRWNAAGDLSDRFFAGGTFLGAGEQRLEGEPLTGKIVSVDAARSRIVVKSDRADAEAAGFVGRVVHFINEQRRTAHTIASAERKGDDIILTTSDDLLVGRARVEEVKPTQIATGTALPLEPIYRGVTLADETFQPIARVTEVKKGQISLATAIREGARPASGEDVWLINVGPGDQFELPAVVHQSR